MKDYIKALCHVIYFFIWMPLLVDMLLDATYKEYYNRLTLFYTLYGIMAATGNVFICGLKCKRPAREFFFWLKILDNAIRFGGIYGLAIYFIWDYGINIDTATILSILILETLKVGYIICICIWHYNTKFITIQELKMKVRDMPMTIDIAMENITSDQECAICLDVMSANAIKLHCQHQFHQHCINEWFELDPNQTCPICRKGLNEQQCVQNKLIINMKLTIELYSSLSNYHYMILKWTESLVL